ncbi:hypothetical protein ACRTDM_00315 [Shewanella algae]|uniref:hypothetical protein n=1 Tax=Shewanella algae TaxID=38313 RepID=UPI000D135370|nr:hypothetical protein [Shewanella algae]PSS68760.1 hypothetical protein AYI85_12880 [Shewanella algae]TVL05261.1 hypothetical protein AYI84_04515 [Shewanella algae]TVL53275.1 hypothetical protein AYI99_06750 [Shewanella algae]
MEFYDVGKLANSYQRACEQKSIFVSRLFEYIHQMGDRQFIEHVKPKDVLKLFDCEVKLVHRAASVAGREDFYCALDFIYQKSKDDEIKLLTFYFDEYGYVFIKKEDKFEQALTSHEADMLIPRTFNEKVLLPVSLALLEQLQD